MSNVVKCPDAATFASLCASFVRDGLTFRADAGTLTIILTGGF